MGGCIKVVLNYFFLEKKKVMEAVKFWPHISEYLWHGLGAGRWHFLAQKLPLVCKIEIYSSVRGGGKLRSNFTTEREWVYNFANASMMTENWQFCGQKLHPLGNFYFSEGNNFFLFHNFNTATDGGLKNRIFE
jgi:hypothetical protein